MLLHRSILSRVGASGKPGAVQSLIEAKTRGGFTTEIYETLAADKALVVELANKILEASFPASVHADILSAVGLPVEYSTRAQQTRDPKFRREVLRAYREACAVCGYHLRVDGVPIGLEAAHIKWVQAGGPDTVDNGILLCSLHHKLFDRGVFTVDAETWRLRVSKRAIGADNDRLIDDLSKCSLKTPKDPNEKPSARFLSWHQRQVFLTDGA